MEVFVHGKEVIKLFLTNIDLYNYEKFSLVCFCHTDVLFMF